MPKYLIFGVIKSLHDVFTAIWIGGMLTTLLALMPAYKPLTEEKSAGKALLIRYQKKLRVFALVGIIGLWITGIFLGRQSQAYGGFIQFSTPYETLISIKHLLIFLMVIIAIYRGFGMGSKIEHFSPKQMKVYGVLLMINSVLGVIVLFLSGISAALP